MTWLREFAGRFRPVGVPGAAGPAAVPADRRAELETELEPVFAGLADIARRTAEIRSRAGHAADDIIQEARERASCLVAAARSEADVARAEAAAECHAKVGTDTRATVDRAVREAGTLRDRARMRMPGEVNRLLARIRALTDEAPP